MIEKSYKRLVKRSNLTEIEKTFLRWKGIKAAEKDLPRRKTVKEI